MFDHISCLSKRTSSLLALQCSVGLGFKNGFITVNIFRVGLLAPSQNLEYQGIHFMWPLPFDPLSCEAWVALLGAYAATSIAVWIIVACRPLHSRAIVLKEDVKEHILLLSYTVLFEHSEELHFAAYLVCYLQTFTFVCC